VAFKDLVAEVARGMAVPPTPNEKEFLVFTNRRNYSRNDSRGRHYFLRALAWPTRRARTRHRPRSLRYHVGARTPLAARPGQDGAKTTVHLEGPEGAFATLEKVRHGWYNAW